jgi:hypothetical protein
VIQIEGANINLGGMVVDKLGFKDGETGTKFISVERRILAATTCYDVSIASAPAASCALSRHRAVPPALQGVTHCALRHGDACRSTTRRANAWPRWIGRRVKESNQQLARTCSLHLGNV